MWGIASALRKLFSTVGDSISTAEAVQYCGGIAAVHVGGLRQYYGGYSVLQRDSCCTAGG